jgi:hypothetical protein
MIGPKKMKLAEKKKKEKRKMHQQSKPAQGAWRDGTRSCEGHGNVARAVTRAQRHGEVACNGEAQGDVGTCQRCHVLSSPRITAVITSSLSVVGPWWALEGEGVSIGKDADRMQ